MGTVAVAVTVSIVVAWLPAIPLAPAPTDPQCYNNQEYRNTHEQECMIDQVGVPWPGGDSGGDGGGLHL